jgi:hypothetical protein
MQGTAKKAPVTQRGTDRQSKRENHPHGMRKSWRGWREKSKGTQKAHHHGYQGFTVDG